MYTSRIIYEEMVLKKKKKILQSLCRNSENNHLTFHIPSKHDFEPLYFRNLLVKMCKTKCLILNET